MVRPRINPDRAQTGAEKTRAWRGKQAAAHEAAVKESSARNDALGALANSLAVAAASGVLSVGLLGQILHEAAMYARGWDEQPGDEPDELGWSQQGEATVGQFIDSVMDLWEGQAEGEGIAPPPPWLKKRFKSWLVSDEKSHDMPSFHDRINELRDQSESDESSRDRSQLSLLEALDAEARMICLAAAGSVEGQPVLSKVAGGPLARRLLEAMATGSRLDAIAVATLLLAPELSDGVRDRMRVHLERQFRTAGACEYEARDKSSCPGS